MDVDRDRFLKEGYVVLRGVVPPDELEPLRASYEVLVEHQKQIWADTREADDPPGGHWETAMQPRLNLGAPPLADLIDERSAAAVEIWLHEHTQRASSQLLGVEDAAVTQMSLMCSPPYKDFGPAQWHRDFFPAYCAPLQAYAEDIAEAGPRYVQWNLSLYDDDVLWVVPGSHLRPNTEDENRQLIEDNHAPLDRGVQTHLEAGDGVVYILPILHWGSNYSTRLRRCIHGGFSVYTSYETRSYMDCLSSGARSTFQRWIERGACMTDHTEAVLRAAIEKNGPGYHAALDRLHPGRGEKGKLTSTIYLSKAAKRIYHLHCVDFNALPERAQQDAMSIHPITLWWGKAFAERFSAAEAEALWKRYAPLDASLQGDQERKSPSFQGVPSPYLFNDVPDGVTVDAFIAGWN